MRRQSILVPAMVIIGLAILPRPARSDSHMHVGIDRGIRTGSTRDIDIDKSSSR